MLLLPDEVAVIGVMKSAVGRTLFASEHRFLAVCACTP